MRAITGCLKSTPTQWLPVMSAIAPPHLRRQESNQKWIIKAETDTETPLHKIIHDAPSKSRLKSRSPFYLSKKDDFNIPETWREEWNNNIPPGGEIIKDPCKRLPGLENASRKHWVAANRLLSRHARTSANMYRWGLRDSPTCPKCTTAAQDTDHLVLHCPVTRLEGKYDVINSCDDEFQAWLDMHNLEV